MSKYKIIIAKRYIPNCPEEFLLSKVLKILYHGHMILTAKKLLEQFMKKHFKEKNRKGFRAEKVIMRKRC